MDIEILPFGRFKYSQPFTGSYKGMRFKIVHPKPAEGEENLIYLNIWPEPLCFEKTDDELKINKSFQYSKEGYDEMVSYIEETYNSKSWS